MHRSRNYWRNLALFTLVVTLLAFVGMTVGLAYSRALVLVHPTRHHTKRTPAMVGLVGWETVTFYAPDGVRLEGWFVPPQAEHRAVIVFVHGLATNRAHWLDEAALLARHGYGALLFDLRNHGASEGTLTTFGYFEVEDVRGAIEYLSARRCGLATDCVDGTFDGCGDCFARGCADRQSARGHCPECLREYRR